jgi:hypothetical protein
MATRSTEEILQGAKDTLAKANKFTQGVTGGSTNAFAPKAEPKHISNVPAAKAVHPSASEAPYALAHDLKSKSDNVDQYKKAVEASPNP